jgi:hypothetical protein
MAETGKGDSRTSEKEKKMELELIDETGIFSDMYLKNEEVQIKIKKIMDSRELKALIEKARKKKRSIELLDEVVPADPVPLPFFQRLKRSLKVFKDDPEYGSKKAYLAYLKSAYCGLEAFTR